MKTKEDILYDHLDWRWANDNLNVDCVLQAMQEYAEEYHREKMESVTNEMILNKIKCMYPSTLTSNYAIGLREGYEIGAQDMRNGNIGEYLKWPDESEDFNQPLNEPINL
jgi:hypothetical protein